MKYDPEKHHRRSIRLKEYDYAQSGAYFVTICTQNRVCLFGTAANGEMELNNAGQIVKSTWEGLPARFPSARLDVFVVMPNHIHGIIIVGAQFIAPADGFGTATTDPGARNPGAINRAPTTLGEIIRAYKAASTRFIRQAGTTEFAWQRNYYEHVVRNEESLDRIRRYIVENPAGWTTDRENPEATTHEADDAWRG